MKAMITGVATRTNYEDSRIEVTMELALFNAFYDSRETQEFFDQLKPGRMIDYIGLRGELIPEVFTNGAVEISPTRQFDFD